MTTTTDLKATFDTQKQNQWRAKASTAEERKGKLEKLKATIAANEAGILAALHADLRKTEAEATTEMSGIYGDIDDAIAHLDEWMKPVPVESSPHMQGTHASIVYEPRGVCLLFAPWNFPFLLTFQPLVPIIAAGNCAIVKPNEMAPETSKVCAKVIREAFDPVDVAVFEGGVELANQLLELPFDHIFFTGSPKVGRTVMAAAARHLTSVTLELGGKCPAIVDGTTDLAQVAAQIGTGRFYNSGQVCLCPDIVWVKEELRDELVKQLTQFIQASFYVDGAINKQAFGRIIDRRNFDRVKSYLDDAVARGARVAVGGTLEAGDLTIHPTILLDPPLDSVIMQEEVFGPILSVQTFTDPSRISDYMQRNGKPLAMYIFSKDQAFIDRLLATTSSGGVSINGWAAHFFEHKLPFGGVNESGMGAYHGIHGFRELSHARSVLTVPVA